MRSLKFIHQHLKVLLGLPEVPRPGIRSLKFWRQAVMADEDESASDVAQVTETPRRRKRYDNELKDRANVLYAGLVTEGCYSHSDALQQTAEALQVSMFSLRNWIGQERSSAKRGRPSLLSCEEDKVAMLETIRLYSHAGHASDQQLLREGVRSCLSS